MRNSIALTVVALSCVAATNAAACNPPPIMSEEARAAAVLGAQRSLWSTSASVFIVQTENRRRN